MNEPIDAEEFEEPEIVQDRSSKPYLEMIADADRCFSAYQDECDRIDKLYGDLKDLGKGGDAEFQIFWANMEVIKPSIYARPPIPVVTPRFRDRRPAPRKAAEILERALISDFEQDDIDGTLRMVRDDLAIGARGSAWARLAMDDDQPRVVVDHVDRRDFLHQPARKWREVGWVAKRSYMTREEAVERFGDLALKAEYEQRSLGDEKEEGYLGDKTAPIWEMWHKKERMVIWVSEGVETVLDIQPPHLDIEGFFPCPRPAYGTLQRRTLIPIPDMLYYGDQIDEVNRTTARIAALTEAVKVRGFYAKGDAAVSEAIEFALERMDDRQLLVGIPSLAQFSSGSGGRLVEWWPIDIVVAALNQLIETRRQLIEDIYQITGISDIMRGETEASETATAQNIKAQYGSVRIRNHQEEMVRFCRDVTRLKAEIMAEYFDGQTLLEMSQVDDAPPAQQLQQQAAQLMQQRQQLAAVAQQDPRAQQAMSQIDEQLRELQKTVPIDAVMQLLQSQRLRPFVLDIETDSTVQPNEDAEKQRRAEAVAAFGQFVQQALSVVQNYPTFAPLALAWGRFLIDSFRAARSLSDEMDEFEEQVKEHVERLKQQQQQPGPDEQLTAAQVEKTKAETQKIKSEAASPEGDGGQGDMAIKGAELQLKQRQMAADLELKRQRQEAELEIKRQELAMKGEAADKDRAAKTDDSLIAAGMPPGFSIDKLLEREKARDEQMMQMIQQLQEGQAALAKAISAPKRIMRDPSGEAVGVETVRDG